MTQPSREELLALADKMKRANDFVGFEWQSFAASHEAVRVESSEKEIIVAALRSSAQALPHSNWIAPIETVADLINNLLTLDQGMKVRGAYHIDAAIEDRCRARGLSLSREHVIDERIKTGDKATPWSLVIWTQPDQRDLAALPASSGEVRETLENLVAKLEICHEDERYQSVWTQNHFRNGPYTGPQYAAELKAAKEALKSSPSIAVQPVGEWRPIETAPDRKTVLLSRLNQQLCVTAYRTGPISGWRHAHTSDAICFDPTHWQPLPAPPAGEEGR